MSNEIKKIGETSLGVVNPFSVSSIVSVFVSVDFVTNRGRPACVARGMVEFKEGNTSGRQQFTGSSFDDVVLQIKNFISSKL